MILKNNLKSFRFHNDNMTQEILAEKLEVSRQTIIAIEKGKFNPSVKLALKMAHLFNDELSNFPSSVICLPFSVL